MTTLTIHDVLFCDAHLVIHKTMLLNIITQPHQLPSQLLESLSANDRLRIVQGLSALYHVLSEVVLALQGCKPGAVEFVPKSDAIVVQCFIVSRQAWELLVAACLFTRPHKIPLTKSFSTAKQIL